MQRTLIGRGTAERVIWILAIVLLLGACVEWSEAHAYCARCNLRRTQTGVRIAGAPVGKTTYSETAYRRWYSRFVSTPCPHAWRQTSRGWIGLLGGGVACGADPPPAFRDHLEPHPQQGVVGSQLSTLERLSDPTRVRTVLLALPHLTRKPASVNTAFYQLQEVRDPEQEAEWWQRWRSLFSLG